MVGVYPITKINVSALPVFNKKKYTIHPELLDKSGNITEEELLTVRFSNDNDSTLEEKGSTSD